MLLKTHQQNKTKQKGVNTMNAIIRKGNFSIEVATEKNNGTNHHLKGIHLDWKKRRAYATDGHLMAYAHFQVKNEEGSEGEPPEPSFIENDNIPVLKAKLKGKSAVEVNGEEVPGKGDIPSFEKIIADKDSCKPLVGLSVANMEKLVKMAKANKRESIFFSAKNYDGDLIVNVLTTTIGEIEVVLMPARI